MRTLVTMTSATVLSLACATGSSEMRLADRQRIEQEVQLATDSVIAAASRTDAEAEYAMYVEAMHAEQGRLHTLSDLRAMYESMYAMVDSVQITPSVSNIHVLGPDAALWVGEGTFRAMAGDSTVDGGSAAWTVVWERVDGDWMIRHFHQSFVPPDTATAE